MNFISQCSNFLLISYALLVFMIGSLSVNAQVCLSTEITSTENTEEVDVAVVTSGFENILSFQFSISFDTTHYEFIELSENNLTNNDDLLFTVNAAGSYGVIRLSWLDFSFSSVTVADNFALCRFKFKRKTETTTPFTISNEPLLIEIINQDFDPLNISECKTGEPLVQYLKGQLIFDENRNCQTEETDRAATLTRNWGNWNNQAQQDNQREFSGFPKNDGSYSIRLIQGENIIQPIPPSPYYEICTPPISINSSDYDAKVPYESLIRIEEDCPYMQVNIDGLPARACEETFLFVLFENNGTVDAEDAYVEVDLDHRIEVLEVLEVFEYSLIDLGYNKYRLDIGVLPYGTGNALAFRVKIACDLLPEEVLCHEARIFPNEICGVNEENWSGANLDINGKCEGDKVLFDIKNIGTGDMIEALEFVVIEDAVIFRTKKVQLNQGEVETITLPANGSSYYVQMPQVKGYPGENKVSAFLEACGQKEDGTYSTGFADLFPKYDNDFFIDIACIPLADRLSDGLMRATPIGFQAEHFIEPDNFINYKIFFDRGFQTVEIIDSLSTFLDMTTFEMLETGVPYKYTIDENILTIQVEPRGAPGIEDELNSFIEFKIRPKLDILSDTQISNHAVINYAGAETITTNTIFHTIKADFLQRITTPVKEILKEEELHIYPNPSNDLVLFNLKTPTSESATLLIRDLNGQVLREATFTGISYEFKKGDLPSGTYIYSVILSEKGVVNGLFILVD